MAFLRNLFVRSRKQTQVLAMPMLPHAQPLDGRAVLAHLAATWPRLPSILDVESADATTVARIPGGAMGLAHVPARIPDGDLEGPTKLAYHWPEAASAVESHRSHVVVHVASSKLDPLDVHLLHSRLVASVLDVAGAIGVYIGNALLVRSAADYISDIRQATRTNLPLLSWVGFNPVKETQGLSAYSTGLFQFGLRELEVRRSQLPLSTVLGEMADLAHYQLTTGVVLNDGDTFGSDANDRRSIHFAPSEFIPQMEVAVLQLDG